MDLQHHRPPHQTLFALSPLSFHFRQSSADLLSMGVKYLPALMSMANGGGGGGGNAALGSMLANGLGSMIAGGGGGGGGGGLGDGYGAPEYFHLRFFSNRSKLIKDERDHLLN